MPRQKITPTNFVATVYGNLTPLNNSAFSKARLKIFYKGLNRNGSYITDEVAEKLLATLPGTPIVGYFDGETDDFLGHVSPEQNKPYGFVPQDMNFKWEMSLDPDGVYRTYACTDIILWTGRYPVASRVVGKSHSMELNPDTVEGEWVETEDDFYFQFTNAEFFGLCILGNDYEPCFEGSSFYELHSSKESISTSQELQEMFSLYKKELDNAYENQTGGQPMEEEEKNKDLDAQELEQQEAEDIQNSDVEESEEQKPEEKPEEQEAPNAEEQEEIEPEEESDEPEEDEGEEEDEEGEEESNEQEESEQPDFNAELADKDSKIASLEAQLAELNAYKMQKTLEEKQKVIEKYASKLTDEEVASFKEKIDDYESAVELKKEIALCILDKEAVEETTDDNNFALVGKNNYLA